MADGEESGKARQILVSTGDLIAVGGVLAAAFALVVRTFSFAPPMLPGYPGDDLFPRLILGLIILCGAPLFARRLSERRVQARRDRTGDDETFDIDVGGFLITAAIVFSFPFLLPVIGFEIATVAFLTVLFTTRLHGPVTAEVVTPAIIRAAVLKSLVISVITMLVLYLVFVILLKVSMPVMFLPKYIQF